VTLLLHLSQTKIANLLYWYLKY